MLQRLSGVRPIAKTVFTLPVLLAVIAIGLSFVHLREVSLAEAQAPAVLGSAPVELSGAALVNASVPLGELGSSESATEETKIFIEKGALVNDATSDF